MEKAKKSELTLKTHPIKGAFFSLAGNAQGRLSRAVELAEKQTDIRGWLKENGYCAFVANGSILPREEEIHIEEKAEELYERIRREGLDFLYSSYFTACERFLDLPRKQELMALVSRMRGLRVEGAAACT